MLINTQVSRICKASPNNSSANIKLSKTQLHKIVQSGVFLGRLLGPLLKAELPLIKNVVKSLAQSVLLPLGLTAASTTDVAIHKKMSRSGAATLIFSNEEINYIMNLVKILEKPGLLIKGVNEAIKKRSKKTNRSIFLNVIRDFRCRFTRESIDM